MTLGERIREDPVRALAWIEAIATVLAVAADICLVFAVDPSQRTPDQRVYTVSFLATLVCALAIFSVPHAPNRRSIAIAISMIALCAVGWLPPDGLVLFILSAILAARMTFAFGFRGAVAAWVVACLAIVVRTFSATVGPLHVGAGQALDLPGFLLSVAPFSILLALIFGMIGLMKVYSDSSAAAATTAERTRIALDLHDFLGHGLTTLRVQLQNAERYRLSDADKANDYVRRAVASSGDLLADVRETVTLLHDDAGQTTPSFAVLFDRLCGDFSATHTAEVARSMDVALEPTGRIAVALYRMMQEALTNVARHAAAEHVWIAVRGDDRTITATIEDDGRGIDVTKPRGHGLISMRERIASVSGAFSVVARDGGGTIVRATVPVEAAR